MSVVYNPNEDYYKKFGLDITASSHDIAKAFRQKSLKCHPDLHGGTKAANEEFKNLNNIRHLLRDPHRRARYDRSRSEHLWTEKLRHSTARLEGSYLLLGYGKLDKMTKKQLLDTMPVILSKRRQAIQSRVKADLAFQKFSQKLRKDQGIYRETTPENLWRAAVSLSMLLSTLRLCGAYNRHLPDPPTTQRNTTPNQSAGQKRKSSTPAPEGTKTSKVASKPKQEAAPTKKPRSKKQSTDHLHANCTSCQALPYYPNSWCTSRHKPQRFKENALQKKTFCYGDGGKPCSNGIKRGWYCSQHFDQIPQTD